MNQRLTIPMYLGSEDAKILTGLKIKKKLFQPVL